MPYSLRAVGTLAANTSGAVLSPGLPAGFQAGDLHLLATCARAAGETLTVTDWTELATYTTFGSVKLFGRIAVGGDTGPSVNWSGATASAAQIAGFSGSVYTDLTTINSVVNEDIGGSNALFQYDPITPAHDGCIVLIIGRKGKTATTDGITADAEPGFTELGQSALNGSTSLFVWNYVIQTTATAVAAGAWTASQTYETLNGNSLTVALRPSEVVTELAPSLFVGRSNLRLT
jgi:hypothetical protein